jgi:predicted transcriptional regulator
MANERQQEDRMIHIACDVPPSVFGPLLLLLHDCRVENLQTIIPERGVARLHHKQALALPKPNGVKPHQERMAQRLQVRERLLAALGEYPDGITARDMLGKHFLEFKNVLTVSVPMDRLYRKGVLTRSKEPPYLYRLPKKPAVSKPASVPASKPDPALAEALTAFVRQHPAGLSSGQLRVMVGKDRYTKQKIGNTLSRLHKKGILRRVGEARDFIYLPKAAAQ